MHESKCIHIQHHLDFMCSHYEILRATLPAVAEPANTLKMTDEQRHQHMIVEFTYGDSLGKLSNMLAFVEKALDIGPPENQPADAATMAAQLDLFRDSINRIALSCRCNPPLVVEQTAAPDTLVDLCYDGIDFSEVIPATASEEDLLDRVCWALGHRDNLHTESRQPTNQGPFVAYLNHEIRVYNAYMGCILTRLEPANGLRNVFNRCDYRLANVVERIGYEPSCIDIHGVQAALKPIVESTRE